MNPLPHDSNLPKTSSARTHTHTHTRTCFIPMPSCDWSDSHFSYGPDAVDWSSARTRGITWPQQHRYNAKHSRRYISGPVVGSSATTWSESTETPVGLPVISLRAHGRPRVESRRDVADGRRRRVRRDWWRARGTVTTRGTPVCQRSSRTVCVTCTTTTATVIIIFVIVTVTVCVLEFGPVQLRIVKRLW